MNLYTLFTIIGIVAGGMVAWGLRSWLPRREGKMSLGFFLSAVGGIVAGAKLPLLVTHGLRPEFLYTGKSFLGGLVGAFVAINVYKLATRQMVSSFGGRFVIPVAVAAGFGKIGCYFNGCCGYDVVFSCALEGIPVLRHVHIQLVESAFQFCVAVAGTLFIVHRRFCCLNTGSKTRLCYPVLFPIYLVSYLSMRFVVEFVRDEPHIGLGLTLYQWIAVVVIPFGLWILYTRRKHEHPASVSTDSPTIH